jgi:hypothetical protein
MLPPSGHAYEFVLALNNAKWKRRVEMIVYLLYLVLAVLLSQCVPYY